MDIKLISSFVARKLTQKANILETLNMVIKKAAKSAKSYVEITQDRPLYKELNKDIQDKLIEEGYYLEPIVKDGKAGLLITWDIQDATSIKDNKNCDD